MKLTGPDNTSFELLIDGYQFPLILDQYWDSNWLEVKIDVTMPEGSWEKIDPCLLTFELQYLIEWFEECNQGKLPTKPCSFEEPMLIFDIKQNPAGDAVLRIYFEGLVRPPWKRKIVGDMDCWVDFPIRDIHFEDVVGDLRLQLLAYPQRVFRDKNGKMQP
jgi:hypothetical protein